MAQTIAQILQANGGKMTGSASGATAKSSAQISAILQAAGGKQTGGTTQTQSQGQSPIAGLPFGQTISDMGTGADKQIASLPFTIASLGKNIANTAGDAAGYIGNKVGLPAAGNAVKGFLSTTPGGAADISTQTPAALQPKGMGEQAGSIAAQIGELFLPGGAEKAAIGGIDDLVNGLDDAKIAAQFGENAPAVVKGLLKMAGAGGVTATSMGGVTAAQTGGNVGQTETAAITGGAAGALGKGLELISPGISSMLEKSNFKLSPTQATKLGDKADAAASFISDNKIAGTTAMKATKLDSLTSDMESAVQASIPDATVPKQPLIDSLNAIPEQFKSSDPAIYQKVKNDVSTAVTTLQETSGGTMNLNDVLSSKRSYGSAAYDKAGMAMLKESKMAISNVFYDALQSSMKDNDSTVQIPEKIQKYFGGVSELPIKDFNATYSKAVKASQLTDAASNKKDMGLVTRLLIAGLGATIGEKQGGIPGALTGAGLAYGAEELGTSGLASGGRTALGLGMQGAASTIPAVVKTGLPMFNQNDQSPNQ